MGSTHGDSSSPLPHGVGVASGSGSRSVNGFTVVQLSLKGLDLVLESVYLVLGRSATVALYNVQK